jgi:hypothetical protein
VSFRLLYLIMIRVFGWLVLCVPKTSSTSCDQVIFVDQATGASLFSNTVLAEVDWLG